MALGEASNIFKGGFEYNNNTNVLSIAVNKEYHASLNKNNIIFTFGSNDIIIGDGYIKAETGLSIYIGNTAELYLDNNNLRPYVNNGLSLGNSSNYFNDGYFTRITMPSDNTVIGYQSGPDLNSSGNSLFGCQAGHDLTDGYDNTAIGYNAFGSTTSYFNSTCIGANSIVSGSCQVQLGDSTTTTYAYGAIQDRSDIRDKADIRDTVFGLEFIKKLHPVDFKWDYREDYQEGQEKDGSKKRNRYHHGFIAQEVKSTCDELGLDFGGYQDHKISGGKDINTLGYSEFISILIKAVQEQQIIIENLETRIKTLETK
jgi:hypothetical protein